MAQSFKLQEFVAHSEDINCVKFGRKSGQVIVTGGDDRNVNMWRVGKPNNVMSLSGHQSPVQCVTFDAKEEKVVAGSKGGSLKCFDLQEGKVYRTLTGHMSTCTCVDFHPYGQFIASGSLDTNLKIWDARTKTCIQTYKGHTSDINKVHFSPDGRWVASGSKDGTLKLWDLTAGKLLHQFTDFTGGVTGIEFNPCEFIISAASEDKCIRVYDLEHFELIATTPADTSKIRSISHSADGQFILSSTQDQMKVWSFDTIVQCYDSVDVAWNRVADTVLCVNGDNTQLIGSSINSTFLSVFVVDLGQVRPFNGEAEEKSEHVAPVVPEQLSPQSSPSAELVKPTTPNINHRSKNYHQQHHDVTLPPPIDLIRPAETESSNNYDAGEKHPPTRPSSRESKSRGRLRTPPAVQLAVNTVAVVPEHSAPAVIPEAKPGLNFADFVSDVDPAMAAPQKLLSTKDLIGQIENGRDIFNKALSGRLNNLNIVSSYWSDGDVIGAIRHMSHQPERMRQMTAADVLASIEWKNNPINLESCSMILPLATELLMSNFESYISTGLSASMNLFSGFSHIVKTTRDAARFHGTRRAVDISREDRLERCEACYQEFVNLHKELGRLKQVNNHKNLVPMIENLNDMLGNFFAGY